MGRIFGTFFFFGGAGWLEGREGVRVHRLGLRWQASLRFWVSATKIPAILRVSIVTNDLRASRSWLCMVMKHAKFPLGVREPKTLAETQNPFINVD